MALVDNMAKPDFQQPFSVASAIQRVKTFMKSLVDIEGKKVVVNEKTFCLVIHGITQEYYNAVFPDAQDTRAASCPPPPLELGADVNWKIYLFVNERLKDNYDNMLDTVLEEIKKLDYEDVMFENAASNVNSNSNNSNNNSNNNNSNNNSGYNANIDNLLKNNYKTIKGGKTKRRNKSIKKMSRRRA